MITQHTGFHHRWSLYAIVAQAPIRSMPGLVPSTTHESEMYGEPSQRTHWWLIATWLTENKTLRSLLSRGKFKKAWRGKFQPSLYEVPMLESSMLIFSILYRSIDQQLFAGSMTISLAGDPTPEPMLGCVDYARDYLVRRHKNAACAISILLPLIV